MRKRIKFLSVVLSLSLLAGCSNNNSDTGNSANQEAQVDPETESTQVATALAKINSSTWNYNEEDDVYWQTGISYCENPADETYETLAIFVPGAYMTAKENEDGTYTCTMNTDATIGVYTAATAPIVVPVNTPGYSAMSPLSDYDSTVSQYTKEGFIYVHAGCRGRDAGAPAGVTDLKAAIRYIRYNEGNIPGSKDRIFSFGMSGGGAQSALLGSTGDSELYTPYLEAIGAVSGVSDAVAGSMCWCPITSLDYADAAYEWNMGASRTDLEEETQALSDGLATAFAEYINQIGLKDEDGNVLVLEESEDGIYQAGSYYEYVKAEIEESLNNFLKDTSFPYDASAVSNKGGMGGMRGELPEGEVPEGMARGELPEGNPRGEMFNDDVNRTTTSNSLVLSGTYETAQDYIDALNADTEWIAYDSETNTATITSISDFVKVCKNASKSVGAFDDLNESQAENTLFGYGDGTGAHFDSVMASLLTDNEAYAQAYQEDLGKTDTQGNTVDTRINMYNPMYYLSDYYDGYQTSNVAKYWRIRTGINQGDTSLTTEVNLALALESYGDTNVDFATVWGQGHVQAERTGDSAANFIEWVNTCLGE